MAGVEFASMDLSVWACVLTKISTLPDEVAVFALDRARTRVWRAFLHSSPMIRGSVSPHDFAGRSSPSCLRKTTRLPFALTVGRRHECFEVAMLRMHPTRLGGNTGSARAHQR